MIHLFSQGEDRSAPTLVLFHGTGGTERDLLPLARIVSPASSVLSIRGNVLENGMPRYFRRLAEGIFDEEDLVLRTAELYQFLEDAARQYGVARDNFVAIGYSNGANIAASLLFHYGQSLKGAILHHPMVPRRGIKLPGLMDTAVFIGAGANDPICSREETEELASLLRDAGADVSIHWERSGHQLTKTEVDAATAWFERNFG
ncbi:alpha/beta hydrolase [Brevibacillus fulvus]|uniref:Phospholipase/carboxylesterase n=1 Tax=Brevibacillus fulvus TaxID=1125967 RepID=A0A939BT89_9BACL|nr:alpha/beta hydrolase [Brevibacillus fulvus]MBM7591273.1 phospholipase/carboxylesterase [Brevibacillus fulvus]